jgi:hypothetical protein
MTEALATIARAEALLREAGIAYEVVARCPDARCSVCEPAPTPKAA